MTEGTEITAGAGNDAVGAALAAKITTNLVAINAGAAWTGGATLLSATYSDITDLMTFKFTNGFDVLDAQAIVPTVAGEAGTLAASAQTVVTQGGNGGSDTFVFEKTAALNGADTINGFVSGALIGGGDVLNTAAFMGVAPTLFQGDYASWVGNANGQTGVLYNKASLTAADITLAKLGDNGKAVILVTADADGLVGGADVTNDGYKMYYVEDTDATAAQNYVVTLVGTINSTTELANASFIAANFA